MIKAKSKIITLILTVVLSTAVSYKAEANFPMVKRLGGQDRYDTCVKVAEDGWSSSYYAVLACGQNYPDALSAVPLAKKYDAPILLTQSGAVPSNVINELGKLHVGKVFLIGGKASISTEVEAKLNAQGIQTERLGGQDRYETSVKIAEKFGNIETLTVATGEDFGDALSISPAAASMGVPVVLVPKNSMPDSVKNYTKRLKREKDYKIFVMGDNSVISDNVVDEFERADDRVDWDSKKPEEKKVMVERIIGENKYIRNLNAIARFVQKSSGNNISNNKSGNDKKEQTQYSTDKDMLSFNNIYIASGEGFADALSGAALAAKNKSPIILSGPSNVQVVKEFLLNKIPNYNGDSVIPCDLTVLGGEAVMTNDAVNSILGYVAFDKTISGYVKFGDKEFEKVIRDKLNIHDRDIYFSDVKNITTLDLSNKGIKDITGIDNFISLKSIDLSYNQIKDIKGLFTLTSLENLNLSHNEIDDVSYISNLTNLKQLNLSDNKIYYLDKSRKTTTTNNKKDYETSSDSVFKYLSNLTFLDLSNSTEKDRYNKNRISSVSPLKDCTSLISLNLKSLNISGLDDLKKLTNLNTLNLNGTSISNLDFIKDLKGIITLDISNNSSIDGKDLEALKNLSSLKYLNASNDKIEDLSALKQLTNLKTLYLEDNPIKDYTPILNYSDSLYSTDFKINNYISGVQINPDIAVFQSMYSYGDYVKLRYAQRYRSYDSGAYNNELNQLYREREWINYKISKGGLGEKALNEYKMDLDSVNYGIEKLNRKDVMNTKVKDFEHQLIGVSTPKEREKFINKINYIYSDYKYDYYRREQQEYEKAVDIINMELQVNLQESANYEGAKKIKYLQYELDQVQKDNQSSNAKIGMYENYKNFFNAVDSILEED